MARQGCKLLGSLPFLVIGVGFLAGGFLTDPSVLMDDGYPLKPFLFVMGSIFLFLPLVIVIGMSLAEAAKQKKMEDLLATGQQGEAVVLGLEDTGLPGDLKTEYDDLARLALALSPLVLIILIVLVLRTGWVKRLRQ